MSIKLDWEVSEAPPDNEARPSQTAPQAPIPTGSPTGPSSHAWPLTGLTGGRPRRWLWWLAALVLLAAAIGGGLWYTTRAGWQRVNDDIIAAVRYEDHQSAQGAIALLMAVQDPGNVDWLALRRAEAAARQPAPRPVPILSFGPTPATMTELTVVDTEFMEATVSRQFATPEGQTLNFDLPQFYRRSSGGDWLRSAPPGSFWGRWLDWRGANLDIRYSERDADFVAQVGGLLDARLAEACSAWTGGCPNKRPVKLYLSGFVGSLQYNPLANVEVLIQPATPDGSAGAGPDYFLSVPSPQIAGIPSDVAARTYLTDYLAVRLIASLAKHISTSPDGYIERTTQAFQRLGLTNEDPGYLVSGQQRDHSQAGELATTEQDNAPARKQDNPSIQAWHTEVYTTVAGDTLTSIAAQFNTPVDTIARANHLANPDQLAVGVRLTIPIIGSLPAAP